MNDGTRSMSYLAPICAIALLVGVTYSAMSSRAGLAQGGPAVAASMPFEYFPAGFANQATEAGEHIPTF